MAVYYDNTLIFSKSSSEHEAHGQEIFRRLYDKLFYLKCEKYIMYIDKVEFLGHFITLEEVKVVPGKVKVVKEWP